MHPDPTAVAAEDQHAVAVLKGDRAAALVRGRIARRLEVFNECDVRGREVVAVHRVLDRELPVAADRVEVRARDHLEPPLRMVGHEIEVLARVTEMLAQARPVEGERHEDEAAVVFDTRQPTQAHGRGESTLRRIGPRIRDAHELARVRERPRVVEALIGLRVPLGLTAEDRAAVRARVQVRADLTLRVAGEDERPPGERAYLEVTRLWDLGLVTQVEPQAIPEPSFAREDLIGAEDLPVHAENARVPVFEDVGTPTAHEVHPRRRGCLRHRRRPP